MKELMPQKIHCPHCGKDIKDSFYADGFDPRFYFCKFCHKPFMEYSANLTASIPDYNDMAKKYDLRPVTMTRPTK